MRIPLAAGGLERGEVIFIPVPHYSHCESKGTLQRVQDRYLSAFRRPPLCSSFPIDKGKNQRNVISSQSEDRFGKTLQE